MRMEAGRATGQSEFRKDWEGEGMRPEGWQDGLKKEKSGGGDDWEGRRALRAHEALPHTPPGGQAPLRPPGPLSLDIELYGSEEICQGFATPAKGAALDRFPRFREQELRRGKGGLRGRALAAPPVARVRQDKPG